MTDHDTPDDRNRTDGGTTGDAASTGPSGNEPDAGTTGDEPAHGSTRETGGDDSTASFDKDAFLEELRTDAEFRAAVREELGTDPGTSRRSLLKGAGTALGVGGLLGGAGTAAADPQGQIGTSTDPVSQVYVDKITMSGAQQTIQSVIDIGTLSDGVNNIYADNLGALDYPVTNMTLDGAVQMQGSGAVESAVHLQGSTADLSGLSMAGNVDLDPTNTGTGNDVQSAGTVEAADVQASSAGLSGLSMAGNVDLDPNNTGTGNDVQSAGTIDADSVATQVVSVKAGTSANTAINFGNSATGLYVDGTGDLRYTSGATDLSL